MLFSVIFLLPLVLFLGISHVRKCSLPTMSRRLFGSATMKIRGVWPGRPCPGMSGRGWRLRERKYLKDADRVIAVSDRDRESFGEFINPGKVTVIQTGVDTDYFRPSSEPEIPNSLVFTGSMDWLPNEDGIVYFINEIFPLVLAKVPGATLCVVGRKPSQRLQDLAARIPNMQLTGWVEDVRPYCLSVQCASYLCALEEAQGSRSSRR